MVLLSRRGLVSDSSMACKIFFHLLIFFLPMIAKAQDIEFVFNGFNGRETEVDRDRVSIIKPSGVLKLTNKSRNAIGHAFYSKPIQMFNVSTSPSSSSNPSSFNTTFVFQIVPPQSGKGGYGFAFVLAPSKQFPGAAAGHFLGLLNATNDGNSSNHIFAVEFDTVRGFKENSDSEGSHVGVNLNSVESVVTEPVHYMYKLNQKEEFKLDIAKPIQAWIEYDGVNKLLNVAVCPLEKIIGKTKPIPLISNYFLDLTLYVKETMYVGFSASTGETSSSHYVMGWSFAVNGVAPPLNISALPMPPTEKNSASYKPSVVALIASLCIVTALLFGILLFIVIYKRMQISEVLEDWELDCPHRFRYQDLYRGTKGFKESEIIGVGGFGAVYKAVLPTTGNEVAVKKITQNSVSGLREFTAEIESLGRLRHKHLVNLQGWCKRKNDLLLVYDYVPNGSLDKLLHRSKNSSILRWKQRLNIIKGIASALLYLHEEWEQMVVHRDIKSGNVLIDADMNARLGDFGLARLYDHGTLSHTTKIVGTLGYIAPELTRTGRASTSSDVFAFGVLLLEVASGRRPVDSGDFLLSDWVMECKQIGKVLDAVDPRLKFNYDLDEMELVLGLGLLCCHPKPEARPTMRQVIRYLNGDEKLPATEYWSCVRSQRLKPTDSRVSVDDVSAETASNSCRSSSMTGMSTASFGGGR